LDNNSEINYWKTYLQHMSVTKLSIQLDYTFPFRHETAEILEKLIANNDQWLLKYQLGLIEWHHGNIIEAKSRFLQCANLPADPNFYAARASL